VVREGKIASKLNRPVEVRSGLKRIQYKAQRIIDNKFKD
jgi:hypothetical protein